MVGNYFITGGPGVGKTTVLMKVVDELRDRDVVGGVYCPEIRENGRRKGFKIIDVLSGRSGVLAHIDQEEGPKVGKYRVDISSVDRVSRESFKRGIEESDVVVVDEIGPMEVYSEVFKEWCWRVLESDVPVLGVIHKQSVTGYIGRVKDRGDVNYLGVEARGTLPLPPVELTMDG
ncbi:NTPase [Methanonatronarchaeum sp. AMET-Sl]|uniref:NTPase n=1 Tax=Methanonatronarchaeum sp. AMET-Sl TaxID=3037654 RepID=UPI00244DD511|nr:NTPase [Methanonatronarchaeum sp. AMET-Sl]WGI18087.1 NTPase [Methanonatronarchaeum sp. AMET-Sl]